MKKSIITLFGFSLELIADELHVASLMRIDGAPSLSHPSHSRWIQELKEYEAGQRTHFDWPLLLDQVTPFQKRVFKAVQTVYFGSVLSYKEVAMMINHPKASRAIGQAMSKNPVLIVIPCHRVVSSNGIGGFSCGLDMKQALLAHENIIEFINQQ